MRAGEGGGAQRLLGLVHGAAPRHAEDEGGLVRRGGAGCDAEAGVPALVDALARILEVQLHALQGEGRAHDLEGSVGFIHRFGGTAWGGETALIAIQMDCECPWKTTPGWLYEFS